MPFLATPQCVEAKLLMTQNSIPVVNRWYFDVGHAVTGTDLSGVFAVVDAWITAYYASQLHNSCTFDQIIVTDFSVANGAQQIYAPTTTTGAATGAAAPANAAVVASLRTAHTGRAYRGRTYTPALAASHILDAQHVTTAKASGVAGALSMLVAAAVTAGYKLCVLSRWLNGALRVAGLLTEIISVIADTKIDSQRRRTAN